MKVLLAIPSKARAATLEKYALQWLRLLPEDIHWVVFVEPQDYEAYRAVAGVRDLYKLERDNQGLGYVKEVIKDYAQRHDYGLVFKLDDDIRCFTNFRRKTSAAETASMLSSLIPLFASMFAKHESLGAVAFPYSFEMYEEKQWAPTKRLQTAYLLRTKLMHADRRISTFEDFTAGLHILVKGYKIMRYGLLGIDCGVKVGGGTGGLQAFDRKEMALKELDLMREIYPPLTFRSVDKPWGVEPDIGSIQL